MLAVAEGDIGKIEGHLGGEEAGGALRVEEMRALRASLEKQLEVHDLPIDIPNLNYFLADHRSLHTLSPQELAAKDEELSLQEVSERKEASMQAVAQQLVPQMNEVQKQHDEAEAALASRIEATKDTSTRAELEKELSEANASLKEVSFDLLHMNFYTFSIELLFKV